MLHHIDMMSVPSLLSFFKQALKLLMLGALQKRLDGLYPAAQTGAGRSDTTQWELKFLQFDLFHFSALSTINHRAECSFTDAPHNPVQTFRPMRARHAGFTGSPPGLHGSSERVSYGPQSLAAFQR